MTSTEFLKTVLRKGQFIVNVLGKYVSFNQCLFAAVFLLSAASFWLSYEIRFDFNVPHSFAGQRLLLLLYVSLLKLTFFYLLRGHGSNWRYVGISDVPNLLFHCVLCSTTLFAVGYVSERLWIPRGVVLIDFFMSIVFIGGSRVGLRVLREKIRLILRTRSSGKETRAVIIGAGDAGEMIVREIARDTGSRIKIAAIFDDDPKKQGHTIHGIRVVGGVDHISAYAQDNKFDTAIIAIPSARNADMRRIHRILKALDIKVKTLPGLNEIIHGSAKLTQLRDITISDLLGREEINIDTELLKKLIFRKTALVTGAGGSIGSELCRQILKREPARLVLLERTENSLFHVNRQLTEVHPDIPIVPVLCDVRDTVRVEEVFQEFRPELVFHAAAHKHVHMQELNPAECVKNNIAGMQILARTCDRYAVSRFLLISTDKAVNPTSVMGATKRVCELYCQAFGMISNTKFLSVRFGNVLASEGSVVPIFMDQIARGGPITVTHPEMRRYFMTIPEAVTLVLQAAALGNSGEIMALQMGEPIKIMDLIQHLLVLMGKEPDEIPIVFVGPRPGEKLFEELTAPSESNMATTHTNIKLFNPASVDPRKVIASIDTAVERVMAGVDADTVRLILQELVPEYSPAEGSEYPKLSAYAGSRSN